MDKVFVKVDIVDNDYDKATDRVMIILKKILI